MVHYVLTALQLLRELTYPSNSDFSKWRELKKDEKYIQTKMNIEGANLSGDWEDLTYI